MVSLTLKQISQRLELLAKSHQQINTVFVGNIGDFEAANKGNIYPACVIDLRQNFSPDLANRKATYNFQISFLDLLDLADNSLNNKLELKSDLASITLDFIAMINYNEYLQDWQVPETFSGTIGDFKLNDVCVGVYFDLPISAFYDGNRCQVPATDLTFEYDSSMKVISNFIYPIVAEATSVTLSTLKNKEIIILHLGDKPLIPTTGTGTPTANEYKYTASTGVFQFGTDLQIGTVLQIINRPF